jgi:ABC-type glycerol-3-phosphate transport system substrate-binding protein
MQTIIKNGGLASSASGNISTAYANIFAISSEDAGITFDTTAALGSIQDALAFFPKVTLGVAPLPTLTGKSVGSTPPGGNGLFIPKANSNLETAAAWDFIKYLTSAASIAKWSTGTGYIPIRTDSVAAWKKALSATQFAWYNVAYTAFSKGKSDSATAGAVVGAYADIQGDLVTALDGLTQSPWPSASSLLNTAQNAATADILSYNSRI